MAKNITGNNDGDNGRNETYRIPGRGSAIPREELVREVEQGRHPGHSVYERDGEQYVRSNPDRTTGNNVNKD